MIKNWIFQWQSSNDIESPHVLSFLCVINAPVINDCPDSCVKYSNWLILASLRSQNKNLESSQFLKTFQVHSNSKTCRKVKKDFQSKKNHLAMEINTLVQNNAYISFCNIFYFNILISNYKINIFKNLKSVIKTKGDLRENLHW